MFVPLLHHHRLVAPQHAAPHDFAGALEALVDQVMTTQEPYASAKRVFWVVDNGSSHRGKAAIGRLAARLMPDSRSAPRG